MKRVLPLLCMLLSLNLLSNAQAISPYTTCPDVNIAIARAGVNADVTNPVYLYNVNQMTGAMSLVPGGPFKDPLSPANNLRVNGIGVNTKDGFIYGLVNDNGGANPIATTARVVRMDKNYGVTSFGNIASPTSPTASIGLINTAAGETDTAGNYYFTALTLNVTFTSTGTVIAFDKLFLGKISNVAALTSGTTPTVTYSEIGLKDANCAGLVNTFVSDPVNSAGLQDFSYNASTNSFFSYVTFKTSPSAANYTGQMVEVKQVSGAYQAFCDTIINMHTSEVAGTMIDKTGLFTVLFTDGSFGMVNTTTGAFTTITPTTGLPNPLRGDMATCGQGNNPGNPLIPFTGCPNVNIAVARAGINKDSTNPYYIYWVNTTSGSVTQLAGGPLKYPMAPHNNIQVNGVGINKIDGFVYGLVKDTMSSAVSLLKFGQNYGVQLFGTIAPPPSIDPSISFINTAAGDMDRSDNYYFSAIALNPAVSDSTVLYLGKISNVSTVTGTPIAEYFPVDVSDVNCTNYIITSVLDTNNAGLKDFSYNPATNTFFSYVTYKFPGDVNYSGQMIEIRPVPGSSPLMYKMYCNPMVNTHTAEVAGTLIDNAGNFEILFTDGTIGKIQMSGGAYTGVFMTLNNMTGLPTTIRADMASCSAPQLPSPPLPVTLSSFTGSARDCNNSFTWVAENEIDFKGYELEQSIDNTNFTKVATVPAKHTLVSTTYTIQVPSPGMQALYRLKMIDQNGTFVYSKTLNISNTCSGSAISFSLYPSLTQGTINLSWSGVTRTTQVDLIIYSVDGRVLNRIKKTIAAGGNVTTLDVSNLRAGMYYIKAIDAKNQINTQQKFTKQ